MGVIVNSSWLGQAESLGYASSRSRPALRCILATVIALAGLHIVGSPGIVDACTISPNTCTSTSCLAFDPVGSTTGACPSGRTCYNKQRANSCSLSCWTYNANGTSSNWAYRATVTATDSYSTGGYVWQLAERGYNNNSGTGRKVCAFYAAAMGGPSATMNYGADWVALPFTGMASHAAIPWTWSCA